MTTTVSTFFTRITNAIVGNSNVDFFPHSPILPGGLGLCNDFSLMKPTPQMISPLLDSSTFDFIKGYVDSIRRGYRRLPTHPLYKRKWIHNPSLLVDVHKDLVSVASKLAHRNLKKSYCYLSLYTTKGICPPHKDRPQCQYTLDLCVSQKKPWSFFVDDREFLLSENDALFYNGTKSLHYRNRIAPDNTCSLVFFHFVDSHFRGTLD